MIVGQRGSPRRPKSESWDSLQFEVVKESTDQIEVKAHLLNKKARYSPPAVMLSLVMIKTVLLSIHMENSPHPNANAILETPSHPRSSLLV